MIINPYVFGSQLSADFIPVFFVRGQSNATGRAEATRMALVEPSPAPQNVYMYWKTAASSTDNGNWEPMFCGANTKEADQTGSVFGGYAMAGIKLRDHINRSVYIINAGDGGTTLTSGTGAIDPDWDPTSSLENYTISRSYYFDVAISKLAAANPGKQIVVFKVWWQGESDAANATATANYLTNFNAFDAADQTNTYLASAIWLISKLDYQGGVNDEAAINTALQSFVNAHPDRAYIFDPSSYPKKNELTTGEKGGYTATTADDDHMSYITQNAFGDWMTSTIVSHYGISSAGLSEYTTNTAFNPSTINSNYIRLQFNRGKMTIGASNIVSAVTNDLGGTTFSLVGSMRFKTDRYKGFIQFDGSSPYNTGRMESAAAVGTTYFSSSFSGSVWMKPASGTPGDTNHICHDIQNTGTPNNSRFAVQLFATGKIGILYAQGGTVTQGVTNSAVYTASKSDAPIHLAWAVESGAFIKIWVNGVLQTLDPTINSGGSMSGITMASYVNGTNKFQIGARKTGASTYTDYYFGFMREFTIQPGVYTTTDVQNLMLN